MPTRSPDYSINMKAESAQTCFLRVYDTLEFLISLPGQTAERKQEKKGTSVESTRRRADPGTDVGEVEAEGAEKWKMNEPSRRDGRGL